MILALFFFFLTKSSAHAEHLHPEKWYQEKWCAQEGGQIEYVLPDSTRVDCLTKTHAIEFDFGKKWADAIGQSLYYSAMTGKRAGVVLIMEKETDRKYLMRIRTVIDTFSLQIDTWVME